MYGKIFDSMYDSTISANWQGMVTFQQMIVLKDQNGIIDMTPPALARRTGIPLDIIEKGIEYLESPDPYSRTPDYDGARIVRLDEHRPWGWFIVNHKHYRELSTRADKSEYDKKRYEKKKSENTGENSEKDVKSVEKDNISQSSTDSTYTNTNTNTDTIKTKDNVCLENINIIFEYWQEVFKSRSKLDNPRKTKIKNALKSFSIDECKQAIDGCTKSPHHMGINDRNTKYYQIKHIFTDNDKIETFININNQPTGKNHDNRKQTPAERNESAMQRNIDEAAAT